MTLDDALSIRRGDILVSKLTPVPYKPVRVTHVWTNDDKTIVRVRLAGLNNNDTWVDPTGLDFKPDDAIWCTQCHEWENKAAAATRHPRDTVRQTRRARR